MLEYKEPTGFYLMRLEQQHPDVMYRCARFKKLVVHYNSVKVNCSFYDDPIDTHCCGKLCRLYNTFNWKILQKYCKPTENIGFPWGFPKAVAVRGKYWATDRDLNEIRIRQNILAMRPSQDSVAYKLTEYGNCCTILKSHAELLKDDSERLSTDFIKRLSKCTCDKLGEDSVTVCSCGRNFLARNKNQKYCDLCRKSIHVKNYRKRNKKILDPKLCEGCGNQFQPKTSRARFCKDACRTKFGRGKTDSK